MSPNLLREDSVKLIKVTEKLLKYDRKEDEEQHDSFRNESSRDFTE